jgi:hypothetical protein
MTNLHHVAVFMCKKKVATAQQQAAAAAANIEEIFEKTRFLSWAWHSAVRMSKQC